MVKSGILRIIRRPEILLNDDKRVITRYLDFGDPARIRSILKRLLAIPRKRIPVILAEVEKDFHARHRNIEADFLRHYRQAVKHVRGYGEVSELRKLLIGAYFTMEYSIESAALFNPSIVPHPDQGGLEDGDIRFLMSLRATGEGHVSSIVFRRGVIHKNGGINFDAPPKYASTTKPEPDALFDKREFIRKLPETRGVRGLASKILKGVGDPCRPSQIRDAVEAAQKKEWGSHLQFDKVSEEMVWLARANYKLSFPDDCTAGDTVIFPATGHESKGMEDLRLVRFADDNGEVTYYGTYTAYDGHRIHPMLLETMDFKNYHVSTLSGRYSRNKGMALFPRKIGGQYMMLARHDGESSYVLKSKNLYVWNTSAKLHTPSEMWELVQVGNCGSPLETKEGWLVLTHGVGPMRKYCIGAMLLDLEDPTKVIGRTAEPILIPSAEEREGYVPNVVYSCGSLIHGEQLVIPYAMSDSRTAFATLSLTSLLSCLTS